MERDWIDYANAFGSIATAATLIWVLIKEYRTRKDITDLGVLAKELQDQNNLTKQQLKIQVRPELVKQNILWDDVNKKLLVTLVNKGHVTEVRKVKFYTKEFEWDAIQTPKRLHTGSELDLWGTFIGTEHFEDTLYQINIQTQDALDNWYHFHLIGVGQYYLEILSGDLTKTKED